MLVFVAVRFSARLLRISMPHFRVLCKNVGIMCVGATLTNI